MKVLKPSFGPQELLNGKHRFRLWAPLAKSVSLVSDSRSVSMSKAGNGFFEIETKISSNKEYKFLVDKSLELADPASRFQPRGISGPSKIISPNEFFWSDESWKGIPLENLIIYESCISTFSKQGNYEGAIEKLSHVQSTGFNCFQVMPLSQFPGNYGWGYDGMFLYAPQNSYGDPNGLKKLVNECHRKKMAFGIDLVYNHVGPGGDTFLEALGPYLTDRYSTPWGKTFNYGERAVRDFVILNALYWINEFHVDLIRLDAIDYIFDTNKKHILRELKDEIKKLASELGREVIITGESSENNPRFIQSEEKGGYGLDAVWSFNFEQAIRQKLTGEQCLFYRDFRGVEDIAKSLKDPNVFNGTRESSLKKKNGKNPFYGKPVNGTKGKHFIVYTSTHDTIGNSPLGNRLSTLTSFEKLKVSASLLFLSPYIPLTFAGDEFGSSSPFLFFTDHEDNFFKDGTKRGRLNELKEMEWDRWYENPDPNEISTFLKSKIDWNETNSRNNTYLKNLYRDLISFRKAHLIPGAFNRKNITVNSSEKRGWVAIEYDLGKRKIGVIHSFSDTPELIHIPFNKRTFEIALSTEDKKYGGRLEQASTTFEDEILLEPNSSVIGWVY